MHSRGLTNANLWLMIIQEEKKIPLSLEVVLSSLEYKGYTHRTYLSEQLGYGRDRNIGILYL